MTTKGIYHTLVTQLDKLARHNRQGSFRTKDRYYEAVKRFCASRRPLPPAKAGERQRQASGELRPLFAGAG